MSIDTETVPEEHKFAIVKPLYKKNSRLDVGNYRLVSLCCMVSKILDMAVYVQLEKYFNYNNLLYAFQTGFRVTYLTDTYLINLSNHIRKLIS